MNWARDITQLCLSFNLAGTVANKIEQSFYCLFLFRNRVNQTHPKSENSQIFLKPHFPKCLSLRKSFQNKSAIQLFPVLAPPDTKCVQLLHAHMSLSLNS